MASIENFSQEEMDAAARSLGIDVERSGSRVVSPPVVADKCEPLVRKH